MRRIFLLPIFLVLFVASCHQEQKSLAANLPDSISTGKQGEFHIQGIAVDKKNGFIYCSFTDKLIKLDMTGHLVGSVTGLVGHLGDLAFDPKTNTIYGSLEFKNDAIGQGILKGLDLKKKNKTSFYIAIFDGPKIVKPQMNAQKGVVLQTAYLREVVDDYKARVKAGDRVVKHRFGCSGIDGVTLGPSFGASKNYKKYLYVAYGIYGDTTRSDNDHQVILKYNIDSLNILSKKLTQDNLHRSGPKKPMTKYFVKTGNTNYGIQNLAYDPSTGNFFAAVYKGPKSRFPNYSLFVINGHKIPHKAKITSDNKMVTVQTLSLLQAGLKDPKTGIRGWNFKWGATGLFPLGQDWFYISHNKETKDGRQEATIYKYKWIGKPKVAFKLIK